ncbi:putative pseudouridylate synthase 1 [Neospora caninum Liverpool]|uniref:Pseudouridylate synthase 1, putative n=1 Tax=Neospora caninum (strain Liverpool) TaxID=572307 RepID=F0VMC7_NEOCL|nr:putative pseudouridylate synthase 1 [Neospora caninum Liverpool]CBZ54405.1 putative pseudouridylate synthase 1 [Neospora caninum Liverpool]CEL69113.1 TPA: pseudouridylate synthase 1, putative [Neospora caninum Liverpool]|eukprot:XP_003884435.1 putative pseudouridylate synthase 1 [Neospora caninum Liverpool]
MSRVLRGLKHIGQGSEKYRFSLHVESVNFHSKSEKTFATVEWLRGPKRCRGREVVVLSRGANNVQFAGQELVLIATLFRSKGGENEKNSEKTESSRLRKFSLRRNSSAVSEAATTAQAAETAGKEELDASATCLYLPKESKLQLVEVQESGRRSFRSFASSRSQGASLSSSLAAPTEGANPETSSSLSSRFRRGSSGKTTAPQPPAKLVLASNVLGECKLDLAQFVNARAAEGEDEKSMDAQQRVTLSLDKCEDANATVTFRVSWTLLGSALEGENDDAVSLHSGLVSLASEETFFKNPVAGSSSLLRVSPGPAVHHPAGKGTASLSASRQGESGGPEGGKATLSSLSGEDALSRGLSPKEKLRDLFARRPEARTDEGREKGEPTGNEKAKETEKEKGDEKAVEERGDTAKERHEREGEGKEDGGSRPLGAASVSEMLKARERSLAARKLEDSQRGLSVPGALATASPGPSPSSDISTSGSTLPVAAQSPLLGEPDRPGARTQGGVGQAKSLSSLLSRGVRKEPGAAGASTGGATPEESKVLQLLQRVSDLERRNEEHQRLLVKAQQALDAKESAERDEYEKKIRNLFSQIEELHSALANAQEQQLTTAQQLEEERAKVKPGAGDKTASGPTSLSPTSYGTLREELQQLKDQMKQAEQTHAEVETQYRMRQKQQQERIEDLQATLQQQQEEAHAERAALQALLREQQTAQETKDAAVNLLTRENQALEEQRETLRQRCEQQEQKLAQVQDRLTEETAARDKAERELTRLRTELGEKDGDEDPLRHQFLTLQQEVSELTATRDELRRQKERDEQAHLQQLHQLQEQLRLTRDQQQEHIHLVEQEKVTLRMQVIALEHEISLLPKKAAEGRFPEFHGDTKHALQPGVGEANQSPGDTAQTAGDAAAARERRETEKRTTQLIEELEMDLVKTKIELALAEQQRAEDLDLCKNKIASLKDTILSYAAVVSDLEVQVADLKLQAQSRDVFGSASGARRLRPIRSLKSFFRSASSRGQHTFDAARSSPSFISGVSSPQSPPLQSRGNGARGRREDNGKREGERGRSWPEPEAALRHGADGRQSSQVIVFDAAEDRVSAPPAKQEETNVRNSRGEYWGRSGLPPLPAHGSRSPRSSFRFRIRSSTRDGRRERSAEHERDQTQDRRRNSLGRHTDVSGPMENKHVLAPEQTRASCFVHMLNESDGPSSSRGSSSWASGRRARDTEMPACN